MKQWMSLMLCVVIVFGFSGCGGGATPVNGVSNPTESVPTEEPKHEHFYEFTDIVAATCTEGGTQEGVCECGETMTREVSELGHDRESNYCFGEKSACSVCGESVKTYTTSGFTFTLKNALPQEFWVYSEEKIKITDLYFSVDQFETFSEDAVSFVFTGEKTYDADGTEHSSTAKVGFKIYDEEGYVVESDTFYSSGGLMVGEKFKNNESLSCYLSPGTYTIELLSTGY